MSIVLSVVFYGIMFSLNPNLLPVLCRCFKPCHLSSFILMGPVTVMQIITPCVATKLKVCLHYKCFFCATFNSLLAKNVFVILINCYFIVHVFGIFSFMVEHFYNQTQSGKTVNTRYFWNVIVLQDKASWA